MWEIIYSYLFGSFHKNKLSLFLYHCSTSTWATRGEYEAMSQYRVPVRKWSLPCSVLSPPAKRHSTGKRFTFAPAGNMP